MRRGLRLPVEELATYLVEVDGSRAPAVIDWHDLFGNANPVEIEVGFGKGLFLVNSAQARPQTNFLGIEIERKYTLFTATRLAKRSLRNAKVAAFDARGFLESHVTAESVSAMHVYFPDPWWKNRHRKRRLFTEAFAGACAPRACPGGVLAFRVGCRGVFRGVRADAGTSQCVK